MCWATYRIPAAVPSIGAHTMAAMNHDATAAMVPYRPPRPSLDDIQDRAARFLAEMSTRRSVRTFSSEPIPRRIIETLIETASTAPSGAHRQPWTFVIVGDPAIKRAIRAAAEAEEQRNYEGGRLPEHWRTALEPLGTDADKPHLEDAPWLVVLFEQRYGLGPDLERVHHYYVKESVGIAAGLFVAAIHQAGLATLTHTPSPMAFLTSVLGRPENERPFCLFPIGRPAVDCMVPDLERKPLGDVMVEVGGSRSQLEDDGQDHRPA